MDKVFVKQIIEAIIFVSDKPVTFDEIHKVLDDYSKDDLIGVIEELKEDYKNQNHGIRIIELAGGYQFATDPVAAPHLGKLYRERQSHKLSKASMETLAIIAYRQPITRSEIEAIRGVNVEGTIDTLFEKNLIKTAGRKDAVGRPILYATSKRFLEHFGLNSLTELPQLPEFTEKDLDFIREESLKIPIKEDSDEVKTDTTDAVNQKNEEEQNEYKQTTPESR